jgi:nucleotide-binding universal stress UspA family protein
MTETGIRQIVVGFAEVETAHMAVAEAASLAERLGAKLHVVTAIDEDEIVVLDAGTERWELHDVDLLTAKVHTFMGTLGSDVDYTVAVAEGKPADVLIKEANRLAADLIVVGNVRMQGMGRLLGSVGNAVAHNAPCSVLIVKTK